MSEIEQLSVIDVTVVITGQDANNAAKVINRVRERFSDVTPFWSDVKFPDARGRKGQKATPVACVRGIVMTLMVLPGIHAANIRRRAAQLLVRYLGGYMYVLYACFHIWAWRGLISVSDYEFPPARPPK